MSNDKETKVREIAYDIWSRHAKNSYCVNLESTKKEFGISKELSRDNYFNSGAFVRPIRGNKYEISINEKIFYASSFSWRFILAHEIGHVVLWKKKILNENHIEPGAEALCNLFADELLLPTSALAFILKEKNWDQQDIESQLRFLLKVANESFCNIYSICKKIIQVLNRWHCVILLCGQELEDRKNVWRLKWGLKPADTKGIYLPWIHNGKRVFPRIKGRFHSILNEVTESNTGIEVSVDALSFGGINKYLNSEAGYSKSSRLKIAVHPYKENEASLFDNTVRINKLLLCIPLAKNK